MKKIEQYKARLHSFITEYEEYMIRKNAIDLLLKRKRSGQINFETFVKESIKLREKEIADLNFSEKKEAIAWMLRSITIIHEGRWMDGKYQNVLAPISEKTKLIEKNMD